MLTADLRVKQKKLNLAFHISNLPESALAKETFNVQRKYKFPGLVTETQSLIDDLNIPNFIVKETGETKESFKNKVTDSINYICESELKGKIATLKKLKDGPMKNEVFEKKPYINDLPLSNARHFFKYRAEMLSVKFNYKNEAAYKEELWQCSSCMKCIETQTHVLFCEAYAPLPEAYAPLLINSFASSYKIHFTDN